MKANTANETGHDLSDREIAAWPPEPRLADPEETARRLRRRLAACGHSGKRATLTLPRRDCI